jgi:acetyl-CoA carboxylase carboxyltransferase component
MCWPSAKIAVMGGAQAAKSYKYKSQASNQKVNSQSRKRKELLTKSHNVTKTNTAYYAASRIWVDAIIDHDIQDWIAMSTFKSIEKFNVGVIQA